jgi:hypothetical protein
VSIFSRLFKGGSEKGPEGEGEGAPEGVATPEGLPGDVLASEVAPVEPQKRAEARAPEQKSAIKPAAPPAQPKARPMSTQKPTGSTPTAKPTPRASTPAASPPRAPVAKTPAKPLAAKTPERTPEKFAAKPPPSQELILDLSEEDPKEPFTREEATDDFVLSVSLDERIDALIDETAPPNEAGTSTETDQRAVREMFGELAQVHLSPVRALISEIRFGTAPAEWLLVCKSAVDSVADAAAKLEMDALYEKLEQFSAALEAASGGGMIEGERRDALVRAYGALVEVLPPGFALDTGDERRKREPVIVMALLRAIDGVERSVVKKMFAAGLRDLHRLSRARGDEIAATTGISRDIADRIADRFKRYVDESGTATVGIEKDERRRLAALVAELEAKDGAFREVSDAWSADAIGQKRKLRRDRERLVLEITVVLARLGELTRATELEPMPVEQKIASLKRLLGSDART